MTALSSMRNRRPGVGFSGYGAAPLKRLHVQPDRREDVAVALQLQKIAAVEGFDVVMQDKWRAISPVTTFHQRHGTTDLNESPWGQDPKLFLWKAGKLVLKMLSMSYPDDISTVKQLGKALKMPPETSSVYLEGGNVFLGKRDDGTPYVLIGDENLLDNIERVGEKEFFQLSWRQKARYLFTPYRYYQAHEDTLTQKVTQEIAAELGVSPGSITFLSQPDFHIDIAVRPLAGNTVLLADPKLSLNLLDQVDAGSKAAAVRKETAFLRNSLRGYQMNQLRQGYTSTDEMERQLQHAGFQVIRVPGIFCGYQDDEMLPSKDESRGTLFTNAIVHQRPNGDLVYITNKSYLPQLNQLFEHYLRTHAPQIKQVYFVSGQEQRLASAPFSTNQISRYLDAGGGVHCLTSEEPDFQRWGWNP